MTTATATSVDPAALYAGCDVYGYADLLSGAERAVLARLRATLENDVKPLVNEYWERGEFPEALRAPIEALSLMDPPDLGDGEPSWMFKGWRTFELARTDVSTGVFFGQQATLFRHSVLYGGSPEQIADLDPGIKSWKVKGVFALTEPDHGSDVARGLETTARREGEDWVITGSKRWIGNATYADYLSVLAKDEADGTVKGFLVPRRAPGVSIEKIERKISLRIVNNGHITLDAVRVPESARLQAVNNFGDVARMLRSMRADVSWLACGAQAGAYEAAVAYAKERIQFGRPIASYQLVQDKLATMLGNLTASLGMVVRLTQLQAGAGFRDEDAALAKGWIAKRTRETVALARELVGGNGITLDTDVARFFADVESIYTFEGTNEVNQLVVGRAITGISAFVG